MIHLTVFALLVLFPIQFVYPQQGQIWIDGFLYKDIGKTLQLETNAGWAKLVKKGGWADYYINNTLSWQINHWTATEGSVELHYTRDPSGADIDEIRLWAAQKFVFTQFIDWLHLSKPYFYVRFDQRLLWYPEEGGVFDFKSRVRPRIGATFIIGHTMLSPGVFYVPWFLEAFVNLNGEAVEKFASKNRSVIGLGYVVNSKFRTEFMHYAQRSRDTIEDSFARTDLIFQLKFKYMPW